MKRRVVNLSVKSSEIEKILSRWAWKRSTFKESVKVQYKIKLHTNYGGYDFIEALVEEKRPPLQRERGRERRR